MAGIYIHIPFCSSRCVYCGFYSTTHSESKQTYVNMLLKEMELRKNYLPKAHQSIETIYFGGGTPSLLAPRQIQQLLLYINKVFKVAQKAEITLECNPDDINCEFVKDIQQIGINRISMGVQTFSIERLKFLKRRHSAQQAIEAMNVLRRNGFDNISIDLIFGFPEQSLKEWETDLDKALQLQPEHISAYSLTYEEDTPLDHWLKQGKIKELGEEECLKMYQLLVDKLVQNGFEHYEISNFARQGRRARHNSCYWTDVPYLGIGAAAHSYDLCTRQWNVENVEQYIESMQQGKIPATIEQLSDIERYNDTITTSLRTCEGIDLALLESKNGSFFKEYLIKNAQKYLEQNDLRIKGNHIGLTLKGIFISDTIMADLMMVNSN